MTKTEQIRIKAQSLHIKYIELTKQAIDSYESEPKENTSIRDFHLKKSAEYISKAEAICELMDSIKF